MAVAAVRYAYADRYPRFDEIAVHPLALWAECILAVVVAIFASVAPALNVRGRAVGRFTARSATRKSQLPGLLVATQVALTCVLLVLSGLFVRTLQSLENVNLGFDSHGITTVGSDAQESATGPAALAGDRNTSATQIRKSTGHSIRDHAVRDSVFELQHDPARNHGCSRGHIGMGIRLTTAL